VPIREVTNRKAKGAWLRARCYACGHRLRFDANGCPSCGEMFDGRPAPRPWPDRCECDRCQAARKE
jgi:hypothetical protein